jgi:hypothetical protein
MIVKMSPKCYNGHIMTTQQTRHSWEFRDDQCHWRYDKMTLPEALAQNQANWPVLDEIDNHGNVGGYNVYGWYAWICPACGHPADDNGCDDRHRADDCACACPDRPNDAFGVWDFDVPSVEPALL